MCLLPPFTEAVRIDRLYSLWCPIMSIACHHAKRAVSSGREALGHYTSLRRADVGIQSDSIPCHRPTTFPALGTEGRAHKYCTCSPNECNIKIAADESIVSRFRTFALCHKYSSSEQEKKLCRTTVRYRSHKAPQRREVWRSHEGYQGNICTSWDVISKMLFIFSR